MDTSAYMQLVYIKQPFVVYAYLTGVINLKAHMICHIVYIKLLTLVSENLLPCQLVATEYIALQSILIVLYM